ncbi:hypothetical protein DPMN_081475 [Dreissena polymorpha]|uniref:Uncharacterized protein n=2 Tax=Dreissena polymorpha TaxID=45954 RepID=A0A9D3Y7D1_DREPO|nr:hypothetical protein DPMN_081475 [Dreissena polymorpha]
MIFTVISVRFLHNLPHHYEYDSVYQGLLFRYISREYHQARKSQLELHFICRPCHLQTIDPEPLEETGNTEPKQEPEPMEETVYPEHMEDTEPTVEPVHLEQREDTEPTEEPVHLEQREYPEPTEEPVQEKPMQVDAHFDMSFDVNHRVADDPEEPQDT